MSYTTLQLITGAYYASGIVSRDFESVSGAQAADALQWLNDIITETNVAQGMIPYETTYTFNGIIGQEKYFIPGLVNVDTLVFYLDSVRYSMQYDKRNAYFGSPRVENINSLPTDWYAERTLGGTNIYLYFKPDKQYPIELHGSFELPKVTQFQDLSSDVTTANLGTPTVNGTGDILPGQLVVNNIDLAGTYATAAALVAYVNTGVIPDVTAALAIGKFVFTSRTDAIVVSTNGTGDGVNNITFADFSTEEGYLSERYGKAGFDDFYLTYLRYALSDRICSEYSFDTPPNVSRQLAKYENLINKQSKVLDLRMRKMSTLHKNRQGFGWGYVNLGKGWSVN